MPEITRAASRPPPLLKQVGCIISSLGTVAVERDGTVVSRCYTDESRQLMVRKYRLKKGEDEIKPEGPGEVKTAGESSKAAPVFF